MNLLEFVEARITEAEVSATLREYHQEGCDAIPYGDYSYPCDCGLPERMAAECAAKRSLIDTQFAYAQKIDGEWGCCHDTAEIRAGECPRMGLDDPEDMPILADIALIYSGHEDYREEWAL